MAWICEWVDQPLKSSLFLLLHILTEQQYSIVSLHPSVGRCRSLCQWCSFRVLSLLHQRQFRTKNQFDCAWMRRYRRTFAGLHHLPYHKRLRSHQLLSLCQPSIVLCLCDYLSIFHIQSMIVRMFTFWILTTPNISIQSFTISYSKDRSMDQYVYVN